jgi:oligopeptide/dipeptide ABC transporter ATP-binding protein
LGKDLLKVVDLKTYFYTKVGVIKAVDNVSFDLEEGESLGIVGESGCGKSTVALSIMKLVPFPGKIVGGEVFFEGKDLLSLPSEEIREVRGGKIAMIFQDPVSSLNPVFRVGFQIGEAIKLHQKITEKEEIKDSAVKMMKSVGIPEPDKRFSDYPHEFSGGMRQRVMISMALSCNPKILIADEPTTSLDVIIQSQILDLISDLRDDFDASIIYITHNLGVVAQLCDKVAVMYAGKIVEHTDTMTVFKDPMHPYTRALLDSIPRIDQKNKILKPIPGTVPSLIDVPPGCRFAPRCSYATDVCREKDPPAVEIGEGHTAYCFHL